MKRAMLIVAAAVAILAIAAVGAFAAGGRQGSEAGAVERGTYHERMEAVMETGTYADLVELREETGRPMMPWVNDEASFEEMKERHEQMEEQYGEGLRMMSRGGRGGGCPILDAN